MNTVEELNQMSKEELVNLSLNLQQQQLASTWERLATNNQKKFNKTSEQMNANQLSSFDEAEETVETTTEDDLKEIELTKKEKKTKKVKANVDYSDLQEKVIHHNLKDAKCDKCDSTMSQLKPTEIKVLKYIPEKYYIEKHIVHNYICNKCSKENDTLVSKSAEYANIVRLFNQSIVSSELISQIIINKYVNGLPLYRQEQDFSCKDIIISRQVMSNWILKAAELYIEPIFNKMWNDVRNLNYLHMDETTLVVIEDKKNENKQKSYEWLVVSGKTEQKQMALYFYNSTRQYAFVDYILGEDFKGYVHSDGYEAYRDKSFINVGCLAHVRRKFFEAYTAHVAFSKYEHAKSGQERINILNQYPDLKIC